MTGSCECDNEPLGSIKCGGISWVAEYQLASQEDFCWMDWRETVARMVLHVSKCHTLHVAFTCGTAPALVCFPDVDFFLFCDFKKIRGFAGLNLAYVDTFFVVVYSPCSLMPIWHDNCATTTSFQILARWALTNHHTDGRPLYSALQTASWNKPPYHSFRDLQVEKHWCKYLKRP